jgi:hypothetical protein
MIEVKYGLMTPKKFGAAMGIVREFEMLVFRADCKLYYQKPGRTMLE